MYRSILVTGATGALGPQVVAELLAADVAERIDLLVRSTAAPAGERFARLVETIAALQTRSGSGARSPSPDTSRLRLVVGDIAHEGLGLNSCERDSLACRTEAILHAAADTRFRGPAQEQREVNVEGTRRLLEWAHQCPRLRRFVQVSTTCVAGARTGRIDEVSPADGIEFVNHYERTKWLAERLALDSDLPVCVARVSVVMGSHATGAVHRLGALHHVFRWFGRGLIPIVPGTPRTTVDLISAETASLCLTRALEAPSPDKAIWHIAAGRRAVPLTDLMEFVWDQFASLRPASGSRRGGMPRIVDADTFDSLRRSVDPRRDPMLGHLLESIDTFLPGLLHPKVFDTTQSELMWGGPLPLPDWRQTLGRVIPQLMVTARGAARRSGAGSGGVRAQTVAIAGTIP